MYIINDEKPSLFAILTHSPKHLFPFPEACQSIGTKAGQTPFSLFDGFLAFQVGFAEKFVSITYHLFFQCFRQKVFVRQWKITFHDSLPGQSGPRMTLTHTSMARIAFCPQDVGTEPSVPQVMRCTEALYARRITKEDAYIVQHGGFFDEPPVQIQFGMCITHLQSPPRYGLAVL